jgi:large subunit ribosomal protein L4
MKWDVLNIKGQKVKTVELPETIYGLEMNEAVLHSVVKSYRANRRQGTHATKTRSLVSGGGKKPFKQKGTGEARQGSTRSPLQPGGGVAHGPQPRSYTQDINQKTKQLALCVALSDKIRHNRLTIVDDFAIATYKTKNIISALETLSKPAMGVLISDERKDDLLYKSARNIHGVEVVPSSVLNAENVLRYENIIISESALKVLEQRLNRKTA